MACYSLVKISYAKNVITSKYSGEDSCEFWYAFIVLNENLVL